jgi:release factor glutamine methyltransferase
VTAVSKLLRRSERYLGSHGVESPAATAEALLRYVAGTDRAGLYSAGTALPAEVRRRFAGALCRRAHGTPLEHITGERQFFDLTLRVRPDVFIPRPETEVVVEMALDAIRDVGSPVVVDVGTGTGAIALALKRFRPDARVLATDVSPAAVELASRNSRVLGLHVDVLRSDLLAAVPRDLLGGTDLLVSNPPYVEPNDYATLPADVRAEPYEALVGGTRVHRALVEAAASWLAPGGALVCEIGEAQGDAVATSFERALVGVTVRRDLAGRARVVMGRRPWAARREA